MKSQITWAAAFALTLSVVPQSAHAYLKKYNLCYISLNNTKEFVETKNFVDRIQNLAKRKTVTVLEFQEKGKSPGDTLKNLIKKGITCHGLVISGHHTGAFGGNNASGSLSIDMLERMACDSHSSSWFGRIRSLWLQGCRTLGALNERDRGQDLADYHAQRVNAVRAADGLTQNQWDLLDQFSTILDSETPYAARFLKVFWRSRIYGWTETAPGEKAESEKSLPYHIHNVARLYWQKHDMFKGYGPFSPELTPQRAQAYLRVLEMMLDASPLDPMVNYASIRGWKQHGSPKPDQGIFGLDNSKLNAHRPLARSNNTELLQSRVLECQLRDDHSTGSQLKALREILKSETSVALSFYAIRDALNTAKKDGDLSTINAFQRELKSSQSLVSFLKKKLASPNLGLARKAEYYSFFKKITGEENKQLYDSIRVQALAILNRTPLPNEYDLRDTKAAVFRAMAEGQLMTGAEVGEIVSKSPDVTIAEAALTALKDSAESFDDIEPIVTAVHQFALKNQAVMSHMITSLMEIKKSSPASAEALKDILQRLEKNELDRFYWLYFYSAISNASFAANHLNVDRIAEEGVKYALAGNSTYMYDIPKALGHRRISLAVRQRLIMDVIAFAKNLQPNEGNKYYSIYPITEFLSAEHVNPSQHPEAVKFLEEVTPSIFSWSGETALEFAFLAIKALAIAKSPFANTLFLRWLRNIEPSGGGALRYAVILAADNRFRSLTLPARYIRGWLNATGSDDFIPLLAIKVIGSANYSEKVRAELVALIDQRPGLSTEERAMILLFMAHGEFPDSEIRRRADDLLGKEPNAPIIRLMALASAVIRPKLYPDLLKLMDRLVPDDESYKSTFLGLRIFATLVAPLSDSERARRLDTALRDEHFNEETLSQLSPSLVRTLNIQHVDRYLELVKKLRQHPLFTDDLRKEYLNEVTQDEDDSSYTIGPDLTDAQKQAIRDALSGGQ